MTPTQQQVDEFILSLELGRWQDDLDDFLTEFMPVCKSYSELVETRNLRLSDIKAIYIDDPMDILNSDIKLDDALEDANRLGYSLGQLDSGVLAEVYARMEMREALCIEDYEKEIRDFYNK